MAYFTEISDYKTYSGKKDDLHFSYNANSGGGQAFLQGSFIDANGNLVPSPELNGREAVFRIEYADDNKATQRILINDDTSKYKIIPRGGDSNNVKFTVDQKTNPSKLIASFFMLPSTGLVKKSRYPNSFPFCCNNYWLQSMWFYAETVQQEIVYLTPRDCIFGCCDVENENIIKYFSFDINKRITDIIQFANYSASFDDEIASCLKLFADIYQGKREYAYKDCDNAVKRIMDYLVRKYPEAYSGFFDPLPFISILLGNKNNNNNGTKLITKTILADINHFLPYLTAIRTKPFLLLAGISGTGKSRLARQLAQATMGTGDLADEQKPGNFELIPVKPNWHDSTELMGYVSRISGVPEYVMTDFVRFLFKASCYPETPFFLCLDEMNLAPVEQYFAEFLSVIETRAKNNEGIITTDVLVKFKLTVDVESELENYADTFGIHAKTSKILAQIKQDGGLRIPPNLVVIGTVNMDETTFSFSRKVLDRAMSFELNVVNMNEGVEADNAIFPKIPIEAVTPQLLSANDAYKACAPVARIVLERLERINAKLEGTPFKIAYRSRNEIMVYVYERMRDSVAVNYPDENAVRSSKLFHQAMDEAVSMKILSRIEGDEQRIQDIFLVNLETAITGDVTLEQPDSDGIANQGDNEADVAHRNNEPYPICRAKLKQMRAQLKHGYVSFWS